MNQHWKTKAPVIIGGIGGSGTRVVAEILSTFGIFMGNDLNGAQDNVLHTLLFKRPAWFIKNHHNSQQLAIGLSLFKKLTLKNERLTLSEISFLIRATASMTCFGHNHKKNGTGRWAIERLINALSTTRSKQEYIGWGWKEPNSHLLLNEFPKNFSHFKYIHTTRHGLDMAFSKNQQQLYNWAELYNIKCPSSLKEEPQSSLKYWLRVHEKIIKTSHSLSDEQFLLLNFDALCSNPEAEILKLIKFLNIEVETTSLQQAIRLPKRPASTGRFLNENLNNFDSSDLDSLSKFGFPLI